MRTVSKSLLSGVDQLDPLLPQRRVVASRAIQLPDATTQFMKGSGQRTRRRLDSFDARHQTADRMHGVARRRLSTREQPNFGFNGVLVSG